MYAHGFTPETIHANAQLFARAGYPPPQAMAMALEVARRAWRKANPRGAYPAHLKGMRAPRRRVKRRQKYGRSAIEGGYR